MPETYLQAKWNITTGCCATHLTECQYPIAHQYATHYAKYDKVFQNAVQPTKHEQNLELPGSWTEPRIIEISPYSDLFNPAFDSEFIKRVFKVVEDTPQHIYMLNTIYTARANKAADILGWPDNLWCGTTVDIQAHSNRIDSLIQIPATARYVNFNLKENVKLTKECNIDWISIMGDHQVDVNNFDVQRILYKQSNHEYKSYKGELYLFHLEIDADKSPAIWKLEWKDWLASS